MDYSYTDLQAQFTDTELVL